MTQNLTQIAILAIYISIFYVAFHGDWNKMSKGIHGFCQNIAQIENGTCAPIKNYLGQADKAALKRSC